MQSRSQTPRDGSIIRQVVLGVDKAKPGLTRQSYQLDVQGIYNACTIGLIRRTLNNAGPGTLIINEVVHKPASQQVRERKVGTEGSNLLELCNVSLLPP